MRILDGMNHPKAGSLEGMDEYPKQPLTTLKRHPERGSYARVEVHQLLDEALVLDIVHLRDGRPIALPTAFVRVGEEVVLHGALANRALHSVEAPFSLTVTLVDGLVFAKSWFAHSMNYRSAVLLGAPRVVVDRTEKRGLLEALVNKSAAGRASETRAPSDAELDATYVVAVRIEHASYKSREGGPRDLPADHEAASAIPPWFGVVPLALRAGQPVPETAGADGMAAMTLPAAPLPRLSPHYGEATRDSLERLPGGPR